MKKLLTGCMAGVLGLAAGMPQAAMAGDREWSAAGKILTGVVAAHVVTRVFAARDGGGGGGCREYVVERPRCEPPPTVVRYYVPAQPVVVQAAPPCPPPPVVVCAPESAIEDPIIVPMEGERRIYQPRIHGAQAYVQVWSDFEQRWVTIGKRPSVW